MQKNVTYEEVIRKIEQSRRFGNLSGVEVTGRILPMLGMKDIGIPFVHVAGTNGKGSVCAFLSSILKEAGFRVGTFTSPHLVDFRERIMVNGVQIGKEDVERLGNLLLQKDFGVSPTMFDYCLAMAILYFREQNCDLLVMETGLGGRLDSTNALGVPEVTVITKIGLDHTEILGDTLEAIAAEKAGIIKQGTKLVLQWQEGEALRVLLDRAKEAGVAEYQVVSEEDVAFVRGLNLSMQGAYQWENGAAAMAAARYLLRRGEEEFRQETGKPKPDRKQVVMDRKHPGENSRLGQQNFIICGLEKARWPGRMEILSDSPFLLVDGAHNGHGVHGLAESLKQLYPGEKFHFLMGVMADKDYETMIGEILPLALDFTAVTVDSGRALAARQLADCIEEKGISAKPCGSLQEALFHLPDEGRTVAFGSLYFIGEVENFFKGRGVNQ